MLIRNLIVACFTFILSLPAIAERVVHIATLEYPPYASLALEEGGPLVSLTVKAFAASGVRAEVDFLPWARAMQMAQVKKYDGLLLLWPAEIEKLGLRASDPLFYSDLGVFLKADSGLTIHGPESLKGLRMGIVRGYGYPAELLAAGANLDIVSDDVTNLRKLAVGRLDAVLLEKAVGEYHVRHETASLCGQVVWGRKVLTKVPLSIGFYENEILLEFNAGLKKLEMDRTSQRIISPLKTPPASACGF
jgi:polar amino acid transport system substrate-binding protein